MSEVNGAPLPTVTVEEYPDKKFVLVHEPVHAQTSVTEAESGSRHPRVVEPENFDHYSDRDSPPRSYETGHGIPTINVKVKDSGVYNQNQDSFDSYGNEHRPSRVREYDNHYYNYNEYTARDSETSYRHPLLKLSGCFSTINPHLSAKSTRVLREVGEWGGCSDMHARQMYEVGIATSNPGIKCIPHRSLITYTCIIMPQA
jgi:hypothetical protein